MVRWYSITPGVGVKGLNNFEFTKLKCLHNDAIDLMELIY